MRQCRYRSEDKAHVQHVLTAIAVNLERIDVHLPPPACPGVQPLSRASSTGSTSRDRGPGASPPTPQAELIILTVAGQELRSAEPRCSTLGSRSRLV
ncbi:hypothetical protein [Streptomyces sp. NPDC051561]|uniref:hypothetical protein n=1 Tax=Streptomyces sp. NPDC051561 TaxID=3365658 RepID=UPI0037B4B649